MSPIFDQKRLIFCQKSHIFYQKSPIFHVTSTFPPKSPPDPGMKEPYTVSNIYIYAHTSIHGRKCINMCAHIYVYLLLHIYPSTCHYSVKRALFPPYFMGLTRLRAGSRGTPTARGRQCRMSKKGQEESETRE